MTEEEWARETLRDWPTAPTSYLGERQGNRKIFLFLAAYLPRFMFDQFCPACRRHLPLFEKHAEKPVRPVKWRAAASAAHAPVFSVVNCDTQQLFRLTADYLRGIICPAVFWDGLVNVSTRVDRELRRQHWATTDTVWFEAHRKEVQEIGRHGMRLLKEIAGNPFRSVAFHPEWRTADVMLLARGIYDEKAFDRMPILADALQDANCTSDDILNHLRDPHAVHVRGCWALDLVLGKE
jgi:hypothetical protein